jgi:Gram-negative bacterial TonB protein C-terminal
MKSLIRVLFFPLLLTSVPGHASAQGLPEFRPALLGRGPRSLVNLINTEALMKRGQGNAIVMFSCFVKTNGRGSSMQVYRCSANSELLQREVLGRIQQIQFEPAVYHHTPVDVWIDGTINFFIANGKPHLRILLNQEEQDLKQGNDFIAPQFAFAPGNPKFQGIYWPAGAPGHDGAAAVTMDVDATGKVQSARVAYEHPPGLGFGAATAGPIRDALFIPGFRNGKVVPCRFTWFLIFFGRGLQMSSG